MKKLFVVKLNGEDIENFMSKEEVEKIYILPISELEKKGFSIKRKTVAKKCPICGKIYVRASAISRKDNKTEICPICGMEEAMKEYEEFYENKSNYSK